MPTAKPGYFFQARKLSFEGTACAVGIEKNVTPHRRDPGLPREPERNTLMRRIAVNKKQVAA